MLPELSLDTTTFTQLAAQARQRIPGLSRGQWTDHNAHDPGITLLELYAYLLEQRVYWLDQVQPALERALLRLLGTTPHPARAARTVLTASVPKGSPRHTRLKAGTRVDVGPELKPLTFTLDESITVLACERIRLLRLQEGVSRSLGPTPGRTVVLFPNDGGPAELVIELTLKSAWQRAIAPIALLFELRTPAEILPQWHPEAVEAPPPVALEVRVSTSAGLKPVAPEHVQDGTGGLRRSGILRLLPPEDWSPVDPEKRVYRIVLSTQAATFTAPPRLVQLGLNAARASHRARFLHVEQEPWPKLPGRVLELEARNGPPLPEGLSLAILEGEQSPRWKRWHEVDDLASHGPAERVFTREGTVVRFGDGLTGRLPVLRTENGLRVRYWSGGGEAGNLAANNTFRLRYGQGLELVNPVPAVGGRSEEPLEDARSRAASRQREVTRAVLAADHVVLAETTPGVAIRRAFAVAGWHEKHPLRVPGVVTVYVLPDAPRGEEPETVEAVDVPAPVADPGALEAVRRHLGTARLLTSEILVLPARYRKVRLSFCALSRTADVTGLRARIQRALRTYLDPLVGGDDGRGWPFGAALEPSALVRRAQLAAGDEALIQEGAVGLDDEEPQKGCTAVELGCYRLPHLIAVNVHTAPLLDAGGIR